MKLKCQRILAHVKRDMTEHTPVIIFVHEFPILQVIHGTAGVDLVKNPERVLAQSTESVAEQIRLNFKAEDKDPSGPEFDRAVEEHRRKLVASMIAPGDVDPDEEYARLVERYGRHVDVPVSNVEYVYGRSNSRDWKAALKMRIEDLDLSGESEPEANEIVSGAQRGGRARERATAA